jgi:hypothetical protein
MPVPPDFSRKPQHDQSAGEKKKLPEHQCEQHNECRHTHAPRPLLLSFRDIRTENSLINRAVNKKVRTVAETAQIYLTPLPPPRVRPTHVWKFREQTRPYLPLKAGLSHVEISAS